MFPNFLGNQVDVSEYFRKFEGNWEIFSSIQGELRKFCKCFQTFEGIQGNPSNIPKYWWKIEEMKGMLPNNWRNLKGIREMLPDF